MTNPNDPAYPTIGVQNYKESGLVGGLSKRERFALELTKALISSGTDHVDGVGDPERFSSLGMKYADALIAELSKEPK